ncbi:helix-turn-helix domain-containing protein [Enterovibrio makurazakiensis]|uniref:helix-turn-helix domain-containing protein n=1 Tax=Enterovibrio makurazakiensis TaxID=2910232 RepID=UPI003D1E5853
MFSRIHYRIAGSIWTFFLLLVLSITPSKVIASPIFYAFPFSSPDDVDKVVDIEYVPNHGVWLLDSDGAVSFYDGVHYHQLSDFISLPENSISRIEMFDNSLWFIASRTLFRFDVAANTLVEVPLGDGVLASDIQVFQHTLWVSTSSNLYQFVEGINAPKDLGHLPLKQFFVSEDNLMGLSASALIDMVSEQLLYRLEENEVISAHYNRRTLWIGFDTGLVQIVDGNIVSRHLDGLTISAITENSDGLWVGTNQGLYLSEGRDSDAVNLFMIESNTDDQFSLSGDKITDIDTGRAGEMWISTDSGLNYHSPRSKDIRRFALSQHFPDWGYTSISSLVTLHGKHYIGAKSKVIVLDENLDLLDSTKLDFTIEEMVALSDSLWVASASGLYSLNPRTLKTSMDNVPESLKGIAFDNIVADSHSLWLVTEQQVFRFWPDSQTVINFGADWSAQRNAQLNAVLDLDEKGSWLGASDGLHFYFDGRFQQRLSRESIGSVLSVSLGKKDDLWLLTTKGVYQYPIDGAREPERVFGSQPDADEQCLAMSENFAYAITTKGIERFGLISGQLHHIEAGHRSSLAANNRELCALVNESLLVASDYGVFLLPANKLTELFDAPLRTSTIGSVSVNGKPWRLGAITLDQVSIPSKSSVMFDIGKMPFRQYEGLIYRLEGASAEYWNETKDQHLQFSALESGAYRLMIRERSQGGQTIERALITLDVVSPWYLRLGAVLLVIMALSLFVIWYYRRKTELVKLHNLQLRHTVHQKVIEIDRRESLIKKTSQDHAEKTAIANTSEFDVLHDGHFWQFLQYADAKDKMGIETLEKKEGKCLEQTQWQKDVLETISTHFHDPDFSLAVLAKAFFTSERSLQRRFKSEFGYTFKEALISARLANAQRMLYQGDKIVNVAIACGFNEPSYFTKSFKAKYGYTPSQFRERCESREV